MTDKPYPTVAADDFARRFSMRAGALTWLLGAGASAAAGIPTAWDMIWEFKRRLFVSQRRVSPKAVADLSNPAIRRSLQSFIDGLGRYPLTGAPDEYAALFEAAYPSEHDRRAYIATKLAGAKPSFGHIALASLTCCSQVFDADGAGLEFVAYDAHEVEVERDNPFLSRNEMFRVMTRSIDLYRRRHSGRTPRRVRERWLR